MTRMVTQTPNLNALFNEITPEDIQRELDHEQSMMDRGRAVAQERLLAEKRRGNASATAGSRVLISQMAGELANLVIEEIARLESGAVKRKPPELRNLKLLPAKDMAVIAIRGLTNAVAQLDSSQCTQQKIGFAIGREVESEYLARLFKKSDRGLFDRVIRRVAERSKNPDQRRKEIMEAYERVDSDPAPRMDNTEKVRLGTFLLNWMEVLGIVQSSTIRQTGVRQSKLFELSDMAMDVIAKMDLKSLEMQPHLTPTLIAPRPWTSIEDGGYWLPFKRQGKMVVARTRTNGIRAATEEEMPLVFEAVNYLQTVPFRINKTVIETMLRMRAGNIMRAGLPPSQLEAVPPKPHDIETNEDARTAWRRAARGVHTRNATVKGKILAVEKVIMIAKELRDEPRLFFPKVIDFRGRVYDAPSFLKPQGDDLSKGLLEFAHGKPLDEIGAFWLAVHGANVWGEDKCSLDDRVGWVENNEQKIVRAADEPFEERFWMDADKPFQFLQFCVDWAGYVRNGLGHISHTPVAMDGSCNGLQHLSAMLRDGVGGRAVNLCPAELPADIYTQVKDKVVKLLQEEAAQGSPTAQKWLPLMERKTVKRPVMTLPYGATKQGFADQIMEDTIRPLEKTGDSPFKHDPYKAAQFLGKLVWQATGETVIAAQSAMKWLQDVAKIVAKTGTPIEWTTPSGFIVRQDYRNIREKEVKLLVSGQRLKLRLADGYQDKMDTGKMALAIAPNFVHSMDAAHMLRTVDLLLDHVGPTVHLAMVHDSYACHAADAEELAIAIRQAFVQMYQEKDWLAAFRDEVAEQVGPEVAEEFPPIPPEGDLEIADVVMSLYFFA